MWPFSGYQALGLSKWHPFLHYLSSQQNLWKLGRKNNVTGTAQCRENAGNKNYLHIILSVFAQISVVRCEQKKPIFTGKHLCWSLFWIKLQVFRPATLFKRDSNTDAFCEYCKIFNNTYFEQHLRTVASVWNSKQLETEPYWRFCQLYKISKRPMANIIND